MIEINGITYYVFEHDGSIIYSLTPVEPNDLAF